MESLIGKVQSVDTGNVSVKVDNEESLNSVQINQIVQIRSTKTGEKIIGLVSKIMRKAVAEKIDEKNDPDYIVENVIRINLVGQQSLTNAGRTFLDYDMSNILISEITKCGQNRVWCCLAQTA